MKPTINIKKGKLIEPFFRVYVENKYPEVEIPSEEDVEKKVTLFREVWASEGDAFFDYLFKEMELEFKRNIIDCFIVSSTSRDMSAPLIIRSRWSPDEFVDVLMHELLHIFFSDNKTEHIKAEGESSSTINHVMVFSLLKKFYLEILKDEVRLNKIISKSSPTNNVDYYKAWQIVDQVGYEEIIAEMKKTAQ